LGRKESGKGGRTPETRGGGLPRGYFSESGVFGLGEGRHLDRREKGETLACRGKRGRNVYAAGGVIVSEEGEKRKLERQKGKVSSVRREKRRLKYRLARGEKDWEKKRRKEHKEELLSFFAGRFPPFSANEKSGVVGGVRGGGVGKDLQTYWSRRAKSVRRMKGGRSPILWRT